MWHLIIGVVLVILGLWGMSSWWLVFGLVMRGVIPFLMVVIGIVALLSSYYRLATGPLENPDEDEDD
jgi:hypothetical protein